MDSFRKNKDLFVTLRRAGKDVGDYLFLFEEMRKKFHISQENSKELMAKLQVFCTKAKKKWINANYTEARFMKKYEEWLQNDFVYPTTLTVLSTPSSSTEHTTPVSAVGTGFNILSESSKRRRVQPLLQNFSSEELTYAACSALYITGKRNTAKIIKTADEYINAKGKHIRETIKYTLEEALSLFIDGNYTKETYNYMRIGSKKRNADIYPPYNHIREAKKECYPTSIKVSDISAEVNIQNLADHTTQRLFKYLEDSVDNENVPDCLNFLFKWGCDGSSGHSTYNQTFSDGNNTDEFLFAICMVPIILKSNGNVLWINPSPSSTRFCRPIKLLFQHETADLITEETRKIEEQISNLIPFVVKFHDKNITVKYHFKLTMIDGKVFSAVTESSSQSCSICTATPRIMNNLEVLKTLPINIDFYQYGISNLHAWIRCMECILHISYRLKIKKWQIRNEADKSQYEERKKTIKKKLKEEMNIIVDTPKPGFGTTNTGNVARTFFENYSTAASITGVNEELIKRLGVILVALSSYRQINAMLFQEYAMATFNLYVAEYNWFYMPSSLHKILFHGADIIQSAGLPIGMFSEEAMEARNKDFRNYRKDHTRKFSRVETMTDLFHTLSYTSDILISLISAENRKIYKTCSRFHIFNVEIKKLMSPEDLQDDDDTE